MIIGRKQKVSFHLRYKKKKEKENYLTKRSIYTEIE